MTEMNKKEKKDGVLPVFLWIFLVATVAVLLILAATLLSRNGTFDRWRAQYKAWQEEKEAAKRAEEAGEKTVNYFGPSGIAEYESWFAGEWQDVLTNGDALGKEEDILQTDPLREALTVSPINGTEAWWNDAKKLTGSVTLYAQAETPLYGAPEKNGEIFGQAMAGEAFGLFAVLENGWYVVTDGEFYYCSEGNRYTMVPLEPVDLEATFAAQEKEKVFHEVESILQKPELPHGCEVTGLSMLLSYYGDSVDKCVLADTWLPKGAWGETDFRKAFVGDPRKTYASAGCYATVIGDTANQYLQAEGSTLIAESREDVTFSELLFMVEEAPVLAWMTMELKAPYIAQVWTVDGEELYWQNYEHCVVLTGYDLEEGIFYGTDPLYGPCEYDMKLFWLRFQTMYSQVVRITEGTSLASLNRN
ncbi:MAG: C39 family peptidase [Lachnospiraceae bacterium]|nr:C39 family peptidase [Lachnospiraceae bacterium]